MVYIFCFVQVCSIDSTLLSFQSLFYQLYGTLDCLKEIYIYLLCLIMKKYQALKPHKKKIGTKNIFLMQCEYNN